MIDFDFIKEDIFTLSENGFGIGDLFYNYVFTLDKFYFNDLTCYSYISTNVDFLKQSLLNNNMITINNFLIGLLEFNAFHKGAKSEYKKIYLANEYCLENCNNCFYVDYIRKIIIDE